MDLKEKIKLMSVSPHCQNCGEINPHLYPGYFYTSCCNEAICDSLEKYVFCNDHICTKACCWAMAETKFLLQEVNVLGQEGMRRIPIHELEIE
jgi:hypothetical protein